MDYTLTCCLLIWMKFGFFEPEGWDAMQTKIIRKKNLNGRIRHCYVNMTSYVALMAVIKIVVSL